NNHKFCRFERREANDDIDDTQVDLVLGVGLAIALDEVRILWLCALERTLHKEVVHKRAHVQANLCPQWLIVRFKDDPLRSSIETLFDVEGCATNGDVLPL